tara:strand:+ start:3211 stop:3636 length:426 start_codon:yes stop_codon:yes gene_type:complete
MAIKVNSKDYIQEDYNQDSKSLIGLNNRHDYNFYLIYDPIVETEEEVLGGPWCFSIDGKRAYLAFSSIELAEQFADLWSSSSENEIVKINDIGTDDHQELLNNVGYLLLLTASDDIESIIKDVDEFPYEHYLIPRLKHLVH